MISIDHFLIYSVLAGIGIAIAICPIGCVMLWRRIPYFGDALAHASILGIVLGLYVGMKVTYSMMLVGIFFALLLSYLKRNQDEESALVIVLSYSFLALGLSLLAFISLHTQVDIFSYLFGDILLVDRSETILSICSSLIALAWLSIRWKKLLLISINEDLAKVEGVNIKRIDLEFLIVIAFLVSISVKIFGVLLVASILVIPATAARNCSNSPIKMLIFATVIGVISVMSGIGLSYLIDSPSGPSIVLSSFLIFLLSLLRKANKA